MAKGSARSTSAGAGGCGGAAWDLRRRGELQAPPPAGRSAALVDRCIRSHRTGSRDLHPRHPPSSLGAPEIAHQCLLLELDLVKGRTLAFLRRIRLLFD